MATYSRIAFLEVVQTSKTRAEAARKMGIRQQTLDARLNRIKQNVRMEIIEASRAMSDKVLEAKWREAMEEFDNPTAEIYFDEMCRRLQKRVERKGR